MYIATKEQWADLYIEESAYSGVKKIAAKVADDLSKVTGHEYKIENNQPDNTRKAPVIMVATVGKSAYLDALEKSGELDLSRIRGKREVYDFRIMEPATLLIAGSDKRGTIYGLFHLSEIIGVSPWVWFADVVPAHKDVIELTQKDNKISREPSVKYRGFFINDEWPSFGNWTFKHFGGFTVQMYDRVFELLLRLKGNYLWPAMWTSSFSLDGPGLDNALLADEYGIVMSNSHHEPCLRHSEEWDLVRGDDSIYGNAWNYDRNKEGLTNYWRDGLKRNGKLENIITMGMRGERDSKILGHSATLKENIEYLKEVIITQNQLIRECVNEDLDQVPRMLALYKEVEAYFYGDEKTQGLKDWKELDGVTFMLCEDNFGNMRTLPTRENRDRKGGWGMYYHFDYHGDPVSYEWVNSTHLSKVWEQMSEAYDYGIRDIWVVNVGDLKPQELPLSYFLDLAYDFDQWGTAAPNQTQKYTREWIKMQFGAFFSEEEQKRIYQVLDGYTRLNSIRKPEALYVDTYHPVHYGEAQWLLDQSKRIINLAQGLEQSLLERLERESGRSLKEIKNKDLTYASFYELLYYPAVASMNQIQMQLSGGRNLLYARQGRIEANEYAAAVLKCIEREKELQQIYHSIADSKWDGMMMSEHVGFVHWNDEECTYPLQCYVTPANKPRMIVAPACGEEYTMGGDWTRKTIYLEDFLNPKCTEISLDIANGGRVPFTYTAECDADWVVLSQTKGEVLVTDKLLLTIDRKNLSGISGIQTAHLCIKTDFAKVNVEISGCDYKEEVLQDKHYVPLTEKIGLAIEADEYADSTSTDKGSFQVITSYGKYHAGVKAYPVTQDYTQGAPSLTYTMTLPQDGEYEIILQTAPLSPISIDNHLRIGVQWNQEQTEYPETIGKEYRGGTPSCKEWAQGVLDQIHNLTMVKTGKKGSNTLTIYACEPFVLERILVKKAGTPWKKGYLGIIPDIFEQE